MTTFIGREPGYEKHDVKGYLRQAGLPSKPVVLPSFAVTHFIHTNNSRCAFSADGNTPAAIL